jgi:hypothetical protein
MPVTDVVLRLTPKRRLIELSLRYLTALCFLPLGFVLWHRNV